MFTDVHLSDAQGILLDQVNLLPKESIGVSDSLGRVVAQKLVAPNNFPPVAQAAVDGFALHEEDLQASSPINIKKYLQFGQVASLPLKNGEAIGVLTGVPVPIGTAAVVPSELVKLEKETLSLPFPIKPNLNIKQPGEDIKEGELLALPGKIITAGMISALLAYGVNQAFVYRKPRVAILGLTSHVVNSLNHLKTGQILDSNGPLLKALITRDGGEVITSRFPIDDAINIEEILKEVDLIITVGGTFAIGKCEAINFLKKLKTKLLFWGVKMKPGSHVGAGIWEDKLILCLSGNPMACAVGYELLVGPIIAKMQSLPYTSTHVLATCTNSINLSQQKVPRFIYGKANCTVDGWEVNVFSGQKSSMIHPLIDGNVLIEIPVGATGIAAGSSVPIRLLGTW